MRKSDDGGLLYRDYHPRAFGEGALPAKAASNSADGEDPWAGWNNWADARADNRIQAAFDGWLAGVIVDALTANGDELIDIVREGFRKRDEQIAELKGRVDVLTSMLTKGAGAVALPTGARKHA
jgi:hypothetical protein